MLGRIVEGYRITRLLGQGAAGSRFEVEHPEQGKAVLRVFDGYGNGPGEEGDGARPFARAARLAGAPGAGGLLGLSRAQRICGLSHRNVSRVYRAGRLDPEGTPFLIEEQISGESLKEWIGRKGPLPPPDALAILAQGAAGLSAIHQAGMSHGNVSTSTIKLAGVDFARGAGEVGVVKLTGLLLDLQSRQGAVALQGEVGSDLRQLAGVFGALVGLSAGVLAGEEPDPRAPGMAALGEMLRQVGSDGRRASSALELYERAEATLRKGGLLAKDDSTAMWLPGNEPKGVVAIASQGPGPGMTAPAWQSSVPVLPGQNRSHPLWPFRPSRQLPTIHADLAAVDDPASTRETEPAVPMERMDARDSLTVPIRYADGAGGISDTSQSQENRRAESLAATGIVPTADDLDDHEEDEPATIEIERMDSAELLLFLPPTTRSIDELVGPLLDQNNQTRRTPALPEGPRPGRAERRKRALTDETTRARRFGSYLSGPGRWLLPLGLCTAITLALAAWALWGQGPSRRPPARIDAPATLGAG